MKQFYGLRNLGIAILGGAVCASVALAQVQTQTQTRSVQNQTQTQVQVPDVGTPVFRVNVISRSINVINFHHRQGSTRMDLKGTALAPRAKGEIKVDSKQGATRIEAKVDKLNPPESNGSEYLTYVLWAITPEGRPTNLGELHLDGGDDAKLTAATELQSFGLVVTAEPYFAVTQPSDVIVMEAVVGKGTSGTISPLQAKYELWPKGMYSQQLPGAERTWSLKTGKEAPPALSQAKHAIAIAKSMGAEQHAADTLRKAENDLQNAEAFFNNKRNLKQIQTVARNATQLAEDARLISIKRTEEARLEGERQAAADSVAAAQTATEREARQRELAESERRLAMERAQAATVRADQEERQRATADQARIAAETAAQQTRERAEQERAAALARQQQMTAQQDQLRLEQQRLQMEADRARAEAQRLEQARMQADADRQRMRDQLREQLNAVLVTRETARGLIVNMSDVLFDTAQHTLRPAAREKLARVSGILSLHSDLMLEVEGHTDSVGGDSYNQRLSERRAESVKQYLISQGVKVESITARGFGKGQPVANNSTAAGRQQNRRVEIVVSGESIRTTSSVSSRATPDQ